MTLIIDTIDVLRVRIPFRIAFSHALASHAMSDAVVVRASSDGRVGHGESVPRAYVSGETAGGAARAIDERLAVPWRGGRFERFEDVIDALRESGDGLERDEHAAFAALELAMLDLAGCWFGRSAGEAIGPLDGGDAGYAGVVPTGRPDVALAMCETARGLGLRDVKLKVGVHPEDDLEIVTGARRILGDNCTLRVDANGAWTLEEARERIAQYHVHGVSVVEQPLDAEDHDGLAALAAASGPVRIAVDESLVSRADAEALIDAGACHLFNVRISKNGGLLAAARLRDTARAAGMPWMLGAQVGETAILSAAGRQLATRAPRPAWTEGSFGTRLLAEDLATEDVAFGPGGRAPALTGPGLGVEIDGRRLARWCDEVPAGFSVVTESCAAPRERAS